MVDGQNFVPGWKCQMTNRGRRFESEEESIKEMSGEGF